MISVQSPATPASTCGNKALHAGEGLSSAAGALMFSSSRPAAVPLSSAHIIMSRIDDKSESDAGSELGNGISCAHQRVHTQATVHELADAPQMGRMA